jgi:hypothetical protein
LLSAKQPFEPLPQGPKFEPNLKKDNTASGVVCDCLLIGPKIALLIRSEIVETDFDLFEIITNRID